MTLTLKAAITATQTTIDVNGADTLRVGSYRQLADEVILIRAADPRTLQPGETAWQRLTVDRGIENSEGVIHAAGVTMAAYSGGVGAGGVTVDNQSDPPESVDTLIMGAAFGPTGTATVTGLSAQDGPAGSSATVTVDVDGGEATVDLQAGAGSGEAGSTFVRAASDAGPALVENKATSTSDTAEAHLDAESSAGIAESRLAVFGVPGAPLAGVTARHTPGGDSLVITGGDGNDGLLDPGYILTSDATLGSKWLPKRVAAFVDPATGSAEDIANALIAAGLMAAS